MFPDDFFDMRLSEIVPRTRDELDRVAFGRTVLFPCFSDEADQPVHFFNFPFGYGIGIVPVDVFQAGYVIEVFEILVRFHLSGSHMLFVFRVANMMWQHPTWRVVSMISPFSTRLSYADFMNLYAG